MDGSKTWCKRFAENCRQKYTLFRVDFFLNECFLAWRQNVVFNFLSFFTFDFLTFLSLSICQTDTFSYLPTLLFLNVFFSNYPIVSLFVFLSQIYICRLLGNQILLYQPQV